MSEQITILAEADEAPRFMSPLQRRQWENKMKILRSIHAEIDPKLDAMRKASHELLHEADGRYIAIPDSVLADEAAMQADGIA